MNGSLEPLRAVIARHGLTAEKSLGQNFILDRNLLARIAAIPGDLAGQTVYEVGPGPGGLTRALLDSGARVVAVERDRRCLAALAELQEQFPQRLSLIHGDALKIDERDLIAGPAHVVANLPYNVGTALLTRWLSGPWPPWWQSLTLMFQLEVAERIVARPNSKEYGRLSILSQWRSEPRVAMHVNRSAFVPPPKVASAVVHFRPATAPEGVEPRLLEALSEAAFGQRRKMLRSSLKQFPGALDALDTVGIDPQRRAETLEVAEFIALARCLA